MLPINADAAPPALETVGCPERLLSPSAVQRQIDAYGKNPAIGEVALIDGIHVYKESCETCHGASSGVSQCRSCTRALSEAAVKVRQGCGARRIFCTIHRNESSRSGIFDSLAMPAFSATLTGNR